MRVADLMKADYFVVRSDATAAEGLHRASSRNAHHVLISERGRLIGVVCTCELEAQQGDRTLGACVTRPPEVTWPESPLGEAAARFVRKSVGCMPVCDGARLVGVITRDDIRRSALPEHELPGGFCCVFCADTQHVRPLSSQLGLGVCLDCRSRGYTLAPYESDPEQLPS